MERNTIRLGEYNYLLELKKSNNFLDDNIALVPLLYGRIINDMPVITDVVFLPFQFINHLNNEEYPIWPSTSSNFDFYTTPSNIGNLYNKDDKKYIYEPNPQLLSNNDYYIKYHQNNVFKCNNLKIYHPNNKKIQNFILHSYSIINSIKYHWFLFKCNSDDIFYPSIYDGASYGTDKEMKIGNDVYSEYITFPLVDIESFFNRKYFVSFPGNIWIDDDVLPFIRYKRRYEYNSSMPKSFDDINEYDENNYYVPKKIVKNITESEYKLLNVLEQQKCKQVSSNPIIYEYVNYSIEYGSKQYIDVSLLLNKWSILDIKNVRKYMKFDIQKQNINDNVNVSIIPYTDIINGKYMIDKIMPPGVCTFGTDNKISLKCEIGFVDGKISVIGKFAYQNSDRFTLQDYYEKTYNVDLSKYKKYSNDIDEINIENSNDINELLRGHKEMCGYVITIASDMKFKNIIWTQSSYSNIIDDFSVSIVHLFTDWNQVPPNVFAKVIFIDKYIGLTLSSNIKTLTKDEIKYTIIEGNKTRLEDIVELQEFDGYIPKKYETINEIEENMGKYNKAIFMNTMNCHIVRTSMNKDNDNNGISKSSRPRVIYKPLFYRTEDSHIIKIRQNVTQNIGVNLSKYMTKVDKFYMRIGNTDYLEIARNGIYVIFKVDALKNQISVDKYDIIDGEGNYITTGSITLI